MATDRALDTTGALSRFQDEGGNALGAALGRLQLLERRARRGQIDLATLVEDLGAIEGQLQRLAMLLRDLASVADHVDDRATMLLPVTRGGKAASESGPERILARPGVPEP